MATLKVDTITSDTLPTVSITDGLSISGVTTNIGKIVGLDVIDIDANKPNNMSSRLIIYQFSNTYFTITKIFQHF